MIPEINLIGICAASLIVTSVFASLFIVACFFGASCASIVCKIKQKKNEKSSK